MTDVCKRFESSLLDLAYGELPETSAKALKTHAATCSKCGQALEQVMGVRKLAAQLPPLDPGDDLDVSILRAASDKSQELARLHGQESQPKAVRTVISIDQPPSFLERLRAFMLAPALVTAAVATLVFVFTFFLSEKSVQRQDQLQMLEQAPFESVAAKEGKSAQIKEPERAEQIAILTEQEVQEGQETALPKRIKVEKQSQSKYKSKFEPPPKPASRPPSDPVRQSTAPSRRSSRGKSGNLGTTGFAPTPYGSDKSVSKKFDSRRPSAKKEQARGGYGQKSLDDLSVGSADEEALTPRSPNAAEKRAETKAVTGHRAPPSSTTADDDFRRGTEAYNRGDCDTAIAAFTRVTEQQSSRSAHAMHHIARCEKRRARCGKAIVWYEKLFSHFRGYQKRADALLEAANCNRRLGRISRARSLLRELSKIPGWESKAKQELDRLSE